METPTQPLSVFLETANPVLFCEHCPKGKNTTSKPYNYISPKAIGQWEDFEYESLQSIYGGVLQQVLGREFPFKTSPDIPQVPYREIFDERSLEAFLIMWNQPVVNEALSAAQKSLYKHQTKKTIHMAAGSRGYLDKSGKYRPDWAGIQPTAPQPDEARESGKAWNILPGDTKVSKKWSSNKIVRGPVKAKLTSEWLSPLNQIYTYCVRANARYGYIITDKELVVFRVRPGPQANESAATIEYQVSWPHESKDLNGDVEKLSLSQEQDESNDSVLSSITRKRLRDNGKLEYRAISWTKPTTGNPRRSNEMTVNLALWWLHIMAAVGSNIKEHYPPLKGIAQPICFGDVMTSQQMCPEQAVRSRKRGYSTFSDQANVTGASRKGLRSGFGGIVDGAKRVRTQR